MTPTPPPSTPPPAGDSGDLTERALAVKRRYQDELMRKANVVGVGVGLRRIGGQPTNDIAIVVMVSRKLPRTQIAPGDVIPSMLDGIPVDVQETGEFGAW